MHAAVKLLRFIGAAALLLAQLGALGWICWAAVDIRMHAVNNYGRVSSAAPPLRCATVPLSAPPVRSSSAPSIRARLLRRCVCRLLGR